MKTDYFSRVEQFFNKPSIYLSGRPGIQLRMDAVGELAGSPQGCRLLDVGCGDGSISRQFLSASNHLTLIDFSQEMLGLAKNNTPDRFQNNVEYIKDNFYYYEPKDAFDIVLCIGVLAHVPSIPEAILKLSKLVKPGGICIVQFSDIAHPITKVQLLYSSLYDMVRRQSTYSVSTIRYGSFLNLIEKNHFDLIETHRYFSMLPGMRLLPGRVAYQLLSGLYRSKFFSVLGTEILAKIRRSQS